MRLILSIISINILQLTTKHKKNDIIFFFALCSGLVVFAQDTIIKGSILDGTTGEPIPEVSVTIEETLQTTKTDAMGQFHFITIVPLGEQILKVEKTGYVTKRYPIIVNVGKTVDISGMTLDYDQSDKKDLFIISISDDNLNSEEDGLTDNISGLLQSSKDVFLRAAAFDFSATFFRPRGLDNANGKILINGVEMNKQFNGRPQWGNWGGLNDVQRNQEFTMGSTANDYTFGDLAGTNNILMRASKYREGGRFSYASANRSYTDRVMASYNSGLLKGGWSYSVLASRRSGNEGFVDGTLYDSNSFFASVEKQINENHSINFTGIYAQNRRGRSTAITQEVFDLKGNNYNPFWGNQDGEIRNSRTRDIIEPIFMLNHYWDVNSKTKLNSNIAYQFGKIGNTRIDNGGTRLVTFNGKSSFLGGARNPDPSYYQNLPSYQLRFDNLSPYNYQQAFLAEQEFRADGQLDWNALYEGNALLKAQGGNSVYAIQEDRNDDKQITINTIFDTELTNRIRLNASLSYRNLKSENFAELKDLLGGTGFLDVDFFAEETDPNATLGLEDIAQSDRNNPNRIVQEGDRYKYNYDINADVITGFAQAQFKYSKIDFYFGAHVSKTTYQRNGIYENGNFPGNKSFGKSEKLNFPNYGLKAGGTYKVTGRHLIDFNAAYLTKAPTIRNSFNNARQNNTIVSGLKSENIQSVDLSYIFRSPIITARLTGFYSGFNNGTDIGFYFTEDLASLGINTGDAFVQEITTNIERRNLGAEFGLEAQVTPTLKLKAAASGGQYIFNNNPNLYLTSDDFDGELRFGDGTTKLKDLHLASGPEIAYQIGFEYRDPDYWWIGTTANFFSNAYVDASGLRRSANFSTDFDGQPIVEFNTNVARNLLKQEQFDNYMLVNIIGGKSWRIENYYVGFFATINNMFNETYRTGGFEQSRLATYDRVLEDISRKTGEIFGSRYFYGYGTTYYLNFYIRF